MLILPKNAERYGVQEKINFINADFGQEYCFIRDYDLIVSNPPYIPIKEMPYLMESVRNYEPYNALAAGEDGLIFTMR